MKNAVVIFNYNLPNKTDKIYSKLILDGVKNEDVIVVDNGSDKAEKATCTNFVLPKNIRFTGQSYIALVYLLDFFDYDNYILITTSAGLYDSVNYAEQIDKVINDIGDNLGYVAASLSGGDTSTNAPNQETGSLIDEYTEVYEYQPIMIIISRRLLELCRATNSAYFNLKLKRGWGIDRELQYVGLQNELKCFVSKSLKVKWDTNLTHRSNVADESRKNYHHYAGLEMQEVFIAKYGLSWESQFLNVFYREKKERLSLLKFIKGVVTKFRLRRFLKR